MSTKDQIRALVAKYEAKIEPLLTVNVGGETARIRLRMGRWIGDGSGDIVFKDRSLRFYVDKGIVSPADLPEELKPTLRQLAALNRLFTEEMNAAYWGGPEASGRKAKSTRS